MNRTFSALMGVGLLVLSGPALASPKCQDPAYAKAHPDECQAPNPGQSSNPKNGEHQDIRLSASSSTPLYRPLVGSLPNVGVSMSARRVEHVGVAQSSFGLSNDRGVELDLDATVGLTNKKVGTAPGLDFGGQVEAGRNRRLQGQIGAALVHSNGSSVSFVSAGVDADLIGGESGSFRDGVTTSRYSTYLRAGLLTSSTVIDLMCGLPFSANADGANGLQVVSAKVDRNPWCRAKTEKDLSVHGKKFGVFADVDFDRRLVARGTKDGAVELDRTPNLVRVGVSIPNPWSSGSAR